MMNQEVKKLWVEAARSGQYKQGMGQLREGNCFCIMGVLCDVYSKAYGLPWGVGTGLNPNFSGPPLIIKEWAGLTGYTAPYVKIQGERLNLVTLNDALQLSLSELADIIEEQL